MADLPLRPLGSSGLDVSLFSLGSWRTFERITRDEGLAVMRRARELGINFLDDARYDDESGTAPIPTGYSEVVFGELYRATGWQRDEVVVANKLWWEFWPEQSAADELDASLGRMRLDHVDLIYATTLPDSITVEQAVTAVAELIESGKALAWGVCNWPAGMLAAGIDIARAEGLPLPCAVQLPYSLVQHDMVSDPAMRELLSRPELGLVASYVLAGGALTGKYLRGGEGRRSSDQDDPLVQRATAVARELDVLGAEWDLNPDGLAIAFALAHPDLTSVLFGATTPEQVDENVSAYGVFEALDVDQLARLHELGD